MLNLSFVRSFVAVAETGSFQLAAARLDLAQPTVSQHLKRLEDALGLRLLERSRTRSRPTPEGVEILPLARSLLKTADEMSRIGQAKQIAIGASANIANYYLASALRKFDEHGGETLSWTVHQAPNVVLVDQLETGHIDIALTEWPPAATQFDSQSWHSDQLVLIVPIDHSLSGQSEVTWEQVTELPLIAGEPGTGTATLLKETVGTRFDALRITRTMGSTEAVKSAVAAGLGCSLILRGAVAQEAQRAQLGIVNISDVKLEKTFYLSVRAGEGSAPWVSLLKECLRT